MSSQRLPDDEPGVCYGVIWRLGLRVWSSGTTFPKHPQ